ncbi:MAG TPA: ABC transporter permease, partial [Acidobacteriota bacterium]|nr:ABC transporter permease [Acidobacteriota bacterium]
QDLSYSLRRLIKSPGFALVCVLTLALGIGGATSLFSVTHAVLLEQLPVADPDELVLLHNIYDPEISLGITSGWNTRTAEGMSSTNSLTYPFFERLQEENEVLESVFAFVGFRAPLRVGDSSKLVTGQLVSGQFFSGLGLRPALGRLIDPRDMDPQAPPVVVLRHGYWVNQMGGDQGVIGRQIHLQGIPATVVGVAPPAFRGTLQLGTTPDIFVALSMMEELHHWGEATRDADRWWLLVMGRLDPSVSRTQAEAALTPIFRNTIRDSLQETNPDLDFRQHPLPRLALRDGGQGQPERRQSLSQSILMTGMLVGLILLLTVVNVSALLLARATRRQHEMAVRSSLGASRGRLIRQLAVESMVLSVTAGSLGVILAIWGSEWIAHLVGSGRSLNFRAEMNGTILLFALGLSMTAGLAFGMLPALRASSVNPAPVLKLSLGRASQRRSSRYWGRGLIAVQVCLAVVILAATGLLLSTVLSLMSTDPGFETENLMAFNVNPRPVGYSSEETLRLTERLVDQLKRLPGVLRASYAGQRMLSGTVDSFPWKVDGTPIEGSMIISYVGQDFFETTGIPVIQGRAIERGDRPGRPVAVISRHFAQDLIEGNALGRILEPNISANFAALIPEVNQSFEVVGVVGDLRYASLRDDIRPNVFLPAQQMGTSFVRPTFYVRFSGASEVLGRRIEEAVRQLDPNLPVTNLMTYREQFRNNVEQEYQLARISSFFSLTALLLVAVGLYGTLSHSVATRRREFGIRMALGADARRILRLVMREVGVVGVGLLAGIPASLAAARMLSSFLYGIQPGHPLPLAAAAVVMLAAASLAAYLPAKRAARIDPISALREE